VAFKYFTLLHITLKRKMQRGVRHRHSPAILSNQHEDKPFNPFFVPCPCEIRIRYTPIGQKNVMFDLANQISEALLLVCCSWLVTRSSRNLRALYVSSSLTSGIVSCRMCAFIVCSLNGGITILQSFLSDGHKRAR